MNKTILFAFLGIFAICRVSFGADNSSEKFLQAFQLFQKAENEEKTGDKTSSLRDYHQAEQLLIDVSKSDPSFQRSVVQYRLKKAKEGIARLSSDNALATIHGNRPPSIPVESSPQKITYQCFIIQSDKPIPHDFSKITNRSGTFLESAPVATGKVDQEVSVKIVNELVPKYVNGQYATKSLDSGLSIFLKGELDQNKIILIGKLRVLDVVSKSETPESTFIATISKEIDFSKIVENGKEAWFDIDCPITSDKKAIYTTARIVPTLTP